MLGVTFCWLGTRQNAVGSFLPRVAKRAHCVEMTNNAIYIAPITSEDTEALDDAGLSLTKQMCL